jgi:hypothetical protein
VENVDKNAVGKVKFIKIKILHKHVAGHCVA